MDENIKCFLSEYEILAERYTQYKKAGDLEMAKITEAKKNTLKWVLYKLGYQKNVMEIEREY